MKKEKYMRLNHIVRICGCELTWNNLEKSWDCPCHGSRFDYLGNAINEPTKKNLKIIDVEE